jgi:predicted permease
VDYLDHLVKDLRSALRGYARQPGFVAIAVLSVAIGIGANAALFSFLNAILLRPIQGIEAPERVVELSATSPRRGFESFSYPDFLELRAAETPIEHLAGWNIEPMSMNVGGAGVRVTAMYVSAPYFDVVGVRAAQGRTFLPEEDEGFGQHPVVVVSHRFWTDELGGDPDVLGATLELNRAPYAIVGVAPPGFRGHVPFVSLDLWVPMVQDEQLAGVTGWSTSRNTSWMEVIGRLRDGATIEQADAAAKQVFHRMETEYPETNEGLGARVDAFGPIPAEGRVAVRAVVGVMTLLVSLILMIICANVAGMMLARSATREREIAIRLALGSSRLRLIRQLVLEGMLLFALGGGAGILVAYWGMGAISVANLPVPVQVDLNFVPDPWVLMVSVVLTIATGVVFGLIPALRATRPELVPALKAPGSGGRRASRLYRASVGGQVAISMLLLVVAGLFLRALGEIGTADPGFEAEGAYVTSIDLALEGLEGQGAGMLMLDRAVEEASSIPGVAGVALATGLPLDQSTSTRTVIPEERFADEDPWIRAHYSSVSEEYFETMRTPLLQGRTFLSSDGEDSPMVVVVNRAFADSAWPGQNPVGRRLTYGRSDEDVAWRTVVGLVGNAREEWLSTDPEPIVYTPLRQQFSPFIRVVARADGEISTIAPALRQAILRADPHLSLTPVVSLAELNSLDTLPHRLAITVALGLGILALFLAGIGVYGVLAFAVTQQTREIGLRMALGADRSRVLRDTQLRAFRMVLPGMILGLLLAVPLGASVQAILYGVSPVDPLAFGAVLAVLICVVALAAFTPARRASRVDPMQALRYE